MATQTTTQTPSILAEAFGAPILTLARHNLEKDGKLAPVLFVKQPQRAPLLVGLTLPPEAEERQHYFLRLGHSLRQQGESVAEALLLMEGWFVSAQQGPLRFDRRPSQHPHRQEAIVLMGRNADHSRVTQVIQPFGRDAHGQPVWEERPLAVYNQPAGQGPQARGLLDYLFAAAEGR
jgi:hypothetical protein